MSENNQEIQQEALSLVQEAQSKKVFNLSDAIKGRSYPKKDVTVYLDDEAAMEIYEINQALLRTVDENVSKELQARVEELKKSVEASAITFTMRGVNQDAIELVLKQTNIRHNLKKGEDGTDKPEWMRDYITMLVGFNIVSASNVAGEIDDEEFDFNKTDGLRLNLSASEWGKLVETMQKLTLAGGYFEQLTDAGFLPRS